MTVDILMYLAGMFLTGLIIYTFFEYNYIGMDTPLLTFIGCFIISFFFPVIWFGLILFIIGMVGWKLWQEIKYLAGEVRK